MKAANKISVMSFILVALYSSSGFAVTPELIFSSQPAINPMTVKSSQVLKYTVTNISNRSIQFNNIDVGPHDNPAYWNASNDCHGVVAAGQSCHITLVLQAPGSAGYMNTALIINYGQPSAVLRSNPIQFDVIAVPAAAIGGTSAKTITAKTKTPVKPAATVSKTYNKTAIASQPVVLQTSSKNIVQTSQIPYTTPVVAIPTAPSPLEQQATSFVPFKDLPRSGVQANLFAGAANLHTNVGDEVFPPVFPVVPPQTNTLHGSSHNMEFTGGGGLGYDFVMPAAASGNNHYWLRDVSLGVNVYYVGGHDPGGEVYRFGLPQFNFDNYDIDLNSTRIMLDSEWDFHPVGQRFVPFVIGGIGDAINIMGYSESPISKSEDPGGQVTLAHRSTHNFAYEVGVGVKVLVTTHAQVSLRYLYTNLGSAEVNSSELAKPLTVDNINTQSILLGYTYEFGN